MSNSTYFPTAALRIPFVHHGFSGQVAVYYGANEDARRAGFDALPGLNLPLELCVGYPAMHAVIERYDGEGYRGWCGWIQVITRHDTRAVSDGSLTTQRSASIDLPPVFQDAGMPFVAFGILSDIFDAPCMNLGGSQSLTWVADTWLVTMPLRSRDEVIEPLLGYRWGYREFAPNMNKPVEILPAQATAPSAWESHLGLLRSECPSWRFGRAQFAD